MRFGPRTSISPSAAMRTSTPATGRPTDPIARGAGGASIVENDASVRP